MTAEFAQGLSNVATNNRAKLIAAMYTCSSQI